MNPLLLRPKHHYERVPENELDSAWLTEIQIRCRAAGAYLTSKQRESPPPFEDVWLALPL
jgi:hypothetical protein